MIAATTPVDAISAFLEQAGYRRLPSPIEIAGMKFAVTAALVGTGTQPDLIIVADTVSDPEERTRSKLEAIARALDTVKSRRPLTVVLAGPRPSASALDAISKICRVLRVGSSEPTEADATIRNWLAVLTPLSIPQGVDTIAEPMLELQRAVANDDALLTELVTASTGGKDAVETLLHKKIADSIADSEATP
ncbi:hypothetical protein ACVWXM_002518 [Bradyrhizobium sp. GM7.3]